jgi:hypothetical protein
LISSISETRVLSAVFCAARVSYGRGASRWEPLIDELAGEGARIPNPGSEGEWKSPPCSACSNRCDGAMLEGWLKFGVPVREIGDCERSDKPEEILPDARRCWARASWPSASGCAAGRPPWSLVCRVLVVTVTTR